MLAGWVSAALLASGIAGGARADDDDDERGSKQRNRALAPVANETYRTECGGCHFAYQPGLLPAKDWERLMGSLDKHFGDDATLDPSLAKDLLDYLTANAGVGKPALRAGAAKPAVGNGPPRITETRDFRRKHDEIPVRLVTNNPEVKSFSNCQLCHRGAEQGNFDEDQVSIPGAGAWKD
jgi:hypothetical protein